MHYKKFNLKNKFAIVSGAGGLLGEMHIEALMESECNIIALDINNKNLIKLKKKMKKNFPKIQFINFRCDVTKEAQLKNVFKKVITKNITPDILINNASFNPIVKKKIQTKNLSRVENTKLDQWNKEIATNLTSYFLTIKTFGKLMAKNKKGVILNISSDLGVIAPNQNLYKVKKLSETKQPVKPISYSVAKHGIMGMTKYIATYWSDKNVRCNCLSPGGVFNNQNINFLKKIKKLIPLGRMANKDEYKSTVKFLCSDASSYMNGQNIIIDGGRSIW